jgi:hypothetical protein
MTLDFIWQFSVFLGFSGRILALKELSELAQGRLFIDNLFFGGFVGWHPDHHVSNCRSQRRGMHQQSVLLGNIVGYCHGQITINACNMLFLVFDLQDFWCRVLSIPQGAHLAMQFPG